MDRRLILQFGNLGRPLMQDRRIEVIKDRLVWDLKAFRKEKKTAFLLGNLSFVFGGEIFDIYCANLIEYHKLDYETSNFLGYMERLPEEVVLEILEKYRVVTFLESRVSHRGKVIYIVRGMTRNV